MSTIICANMNCKFRGNTGICGKTFVVLAAAGMCAEWFDKNGGYTGFPRYAVNDIEEVQNNEDTRNSNNNMREGECDNNSEFSADTVSERQENNNADRGSNDLSGQEVQQVSETNVESSIGSGDGGCE